MTQPPASELPASELLAELARALDADQIGPAPASVEALRRLVTETWTTGSAPRRRQGLGWRKPLTGLGVLAGIVAGGSGVAFAAGAVPEPLRAAVYDIGLPVDSPALSAARNDEDHLRAALATPRSAPTTLAASRTAGAATALARQLSRMDAEDRRKLGLAPYQLLTVAQSVESASGLPITPIPPPPATGRGQSETTTTTTGGDHPQSGVDGGAGSHGSGPGSNAAGPSGTGSSGDGSPGGGGGPPAAKGPDGSPTPGTVPSGGQPPQSAPSTTTTTPDPGGSSGTTDPAPTSTTTSTTSTTEPATN